MDEPRVQKEEVLRLRRGDLAEGQAQFLVSSRWWRQFAEHVQLEADGASFSALREAALKFGLTFRFVSYMAHEQSSFGRAAVQITGVRPCQWSL